MDNSEREAYESGFSIADMFPENVMGVTTARDGLVIDSDKNVLLSRIQRFADTAYSDEETRNFFFGTKKAGKYLPGDSRGWDMVMARKTIKDNNHNSFIVPISYRPFDSQFIYYSQDMVDWPRMAIMKHLEQDNLGLCAVRINSRDNEYTFLLTDKIVDKTLLSSKDNANVFPLYLYDEDGRQSNINPKLKEIFDNKIGSETSPEDILYYIYAVLYSNKYRTKYQSLLKSDFPRIPFPTNKNTFNSIINLGKELSDIHLMKNTSSWQLSVEYPIPGDNIVTQYKYSSDNNGRVYLNETQFFSNIKEEVWAFYIGGYQPAQKWLKDRKNRQLSFEDIRHYFEIIYALENTMRIMEEIDQIIEL